MKNYLKLQNITIIPKDIVMLKKNQEKIELNSLKNFTYYV